MSEAPLISAASTIGEVWRHPLGNDVVSKILMQLGRSPRWVTNPFVRSIRLGSLPRLSFGRVSESFVETIVQLLNQHRDIPSASADATTPPVWWQSAVFYQIYPRSFQDSNGDGIGDIPGLISRLDYLQQLGVDALWLSPIYDSPNDDNGYDIRDYREVMAEFGTMADVEHLISELHARDMRLVMDLVINHTSDEHEWFQQALADPASQYRDYYFFRQGTEAPNNWASFFSGPAWREFAPGDWAMHLFSAKQMDLNWQHEPMRAEVFDMVRWWLEKGIDGFRLDVINYISKDPALADGDPLVGALMKFTGVEHYFAGPRLHEHLRELQSAAFEPYGAVSIGETPGVGPNLGKLLTGPDRGELDMIFSFDHLETPGHTRFDDYRYDLEYLRAWWQDWQLDYGATCWPTLFFENHDNPRMISKVNPDPQHRSALGKLLAVIQLTLRGTPFIYQGQELGPVNVRFSSIADLRDVESINKFADLKDQDMSDAAAFKGVLAGSRDHARVPVAWDATENGGFTTGTPWIVGDDDYLEVNIGAAWDDEDSVLSAYRTLIALRRSRPELGLGGIQFLDSPAGIWSWERTLDGATVRVDVNLTDVARTVPVVPGEVLFASGVTASESSTTATLGAYGARVVGM